MAKLPIVRFGLVGLAGLPYIFLLLGKSYGAPSLKAPAFKDVEAIFKAHCNSCHTGAQSSAGLDLSSTKGIAKGGLSGKLIVPGKPDSSLLMKRVKGHGGLPRMPMGFAPLTPTQLATLTSWIKSGGKIDSGQSTHWAYINPVRTTPPAVKLKTWVRNPIDNFILARLERGGLKPAPQASKETLIRRLTLDLIGLPPTLEEVDAFLADTSPNAYEKVVERLLASKHYGERQARIWLDLARYADTHGYEADYRRVAWKYRDWVIDAFNRNVPYDRFTIDQLGGDMLSQPSMDQLIATGFHRNTMLNLEGGVDPKEARYEMVNDRVATTSTVWLGQTVQCARCHDHKYDPISQKDYFRMFAIFANTAYEARGDNSVGQQKFYESDMPAPSAEQVAEQKKLTEALATAEREYQASSPEFQKEKAAWIEKLKQSQPWVNTAAKADNLTVQPDGSMLATGPNTPHATFRLKLDAAKGTTALRLVAIPDPSFPYNGPGRASSGNFILSKVSASVPLGIPATDFIQDGYDLKGLFDENGDTGWAIHPQAGKEHWLVLRLNKPLETDQKLDLTLTCDSKTWTEHTLGRFRIDATAEADTDIYALPAKIRAISDPANAELDTYFRKISKTLAVVRQSRDKYQMELNAVKNAIPIAMVMREKPGNAVLKAPLHIRGEFLQTGEMIVAGIPGSFGKAEAKRMDRLELAKWLVSKNNPLTARVQVNRMWEQYFGIGIVETSENFGTPGTPPTHPQLLDWLATEFMAKGWDMKAIHRLIVTSATYRQSSNATKALLDRDPENKLLARGPRFRMEAEMIRDNALSAAGLLNLEIGGPSVYPHQPDGIWNSPYSGERWMTSKGSELYRRGLYTFWKRTATYPTFMNFDATSREVCTVRRGRTNTPLQALNLLNDPAFLEAAKGLAKRAVGQAGLEIPGSTEAVQNPKPEIQNRGIEESRNLEPAIQLAFRFCTSRKPKPAEIQRLVALYENLLARYQQKPDEAKKLGGSPEDAAMIMVASVLLNLDETINKE